MAGGSDIRAGGAFVEVYAKTALLVQGLKLAEAKLKAFGQAITTIGQRTAIAGAAIFTPFLLGAKSFASMGNDIWLLSKKTGASTEALSLLGAAAEEVGGGLDTIGGAITHMQGQLFQVASGSIEARKAFWALGLDLTKLQQLAPEEQFDRIAEALSKVQTTGRRQAIAGAIFGGTDLLPLLEGGKLGEAKQRAVAGGRLISREDAEAAHQLSEAMRQLGGAALSVWRAFGTTLAPIIVSFTEKVKNGAARIREWIAENRKWVVGIALGGAALIGLGAALVAVGTAAKVAAIGVSILSGAILVLKGVVIALKLIMAAGPLAIGAAVLAAIAIFSKWDDIVATVGNTFRGLKIIALDTLGGIADAMAAGDFMLAWEILKQGGRAAWLQVKLFAFETWYGIKNFTLDIFTDISSGLVKALTWAYYTLRMGWAGTVNLMKVTFQTFYNFIADKFLKVFETLKGALEAADLGGALVPKEVFAALQAAGRAVGGGMKHPLQVFAEGDKGVKDLERQRGNALGEIDRDAQREKDARAKAAEAAMAGDRGKLKEAQDELARLRGEAAAKAQRAGLPEFKPPSLGMIQERVGVKGGFLATASAGMGRGDTIQVNQLAEAKKGNGLLDQINRGIMNIAQFGRFA